VEVAVTVWGFLAVLVACIVVAVLYLRPRNVVSDEEARRRAMDKAREDAADASEQRQRTAAQIAAEGEAKSQAERAVSTSGAAEDAVRLAGDLRSQADAVASLIGAPPSQSNTPAPQEPPRGGK